MKVGICGTGTMGTAIATRLMDQGHDIAVWNRNAARAEALVEKGAAQFETPAALADECEAIIVMVYDDDAVEAVYSGIDGDMPETGFFTLGGMAKDLRLMHAVAADEGFTIPVADAALSVYDAAEKDGWGIKDGTMIAAWKVPRK